VYMFVIQATNMDNLVHPIVDLAGSARKLLR